MVRPRIICVTRFAELAAQTNFSFLRGASHGEEMVAAAKALGMTAIGIADRNTLAGVVRAHKAAKEEGLKLLVGARLVAQDGFEVIAYPKDRAAYGRLCRLLTRGNRRAPKGECHLAREEIFKEEGLIVLVVPPSALTPAFAEALKEVARVSRSPVYLCASRPYGAQDRRRLVALADLAEGAGAPLVAVNDALYHAPERRVLADVLTCIREKCTIAEAGFRLAANAERHLKSPTEMARLFKGYEAALARTAMIADQIDFSLDELRYEYPEEVVAPGETPQQTLVRLTWEGARGRFPDGVPEKIRTTIAYELDLIEHLQYAPYFLTVYDLVRFARGRGILCQGRGSAANSAVCFALGVTSVDPTKIDLLFERFVSAERGEPPDIDVDFEHERREEVIQYIYEKYGRHRAGIAATVITYRARSAIRDVGKALGLSLDAVGALAKTTWGWSSDGIDPAHVREVGLDPDEPNLARALTLAHELIGFPRHLSQHVGGFVIARGPVEELVPVGNAAMADRTFVEWDKDDLDALGLMKVDVLALGMLTCIAKAFALLKSEYGVSLDLATVPQDDPAVYDMLGKADSIGVFQVESRAQMSMLPRLRPRTFYDLVIEVAIVRPGPIQGGMVHPYLRRRTGEESISFPSEALREVLGKTMGVPLFQEQAMRIAVVGAGFTPSEADRLRRAMATFRRVGIIHTMKEKFIAGMRQRGYEEGFIKQCWSQIEGFGEYGFPESHAASFALLVYVSAWLKNWYPDVFLAAILNAQPLGFYAPAQLVRDAKDHGVTVRHPDINDSEWDAVLEAATPPQPLPTRGRANPDHPLVGRSASGASRVGENPTTRTRYAVRLGFRAIKGLAEEHGRAVAVARRVGAPFVSMRDLWLRTRIPPSALMKLADADAFRSIGLDRRQALWAIRGLEEGAAARTGAASNLAPLPLFAAAIARERAGGDETAPLPVLPEAGHVALDYAVLSLSLRKHPVAFLREHYAKAGIVPNAALRAIRNNARATLAGLVLVRQRPGTAKGTIFVTLEDETGAANLIVWPKVFEAYRRVVLTARVLEAQGRVQREGEVIHLVVERLIDRSDDLIVLDEDYAAQMEALARADEVNRWSEDPRTRMMERMAARATRADAAAALPKSRDFH
ncbi:MAG: DNA polymerase III subunit alpha [Alphaproteobacteria bacterium]|nr:DNA polymerase III subunit alpha [Alphaproteobacteria bacterium]